MIRTQNDNMQKYKEKQLLNNANDDRNKILKTEGNYEKGDKKMQSEIKRKGNKIIYLIYKSQQNNLSVENKKIKFKKAKLIKLNNLNNNKFINFTSNENILRKHYSNTSVKNNINFDENFYLGFNETDNYIKHERKGHFKLNDTEYHISYDEDAPVISKNHHQSRTIYDNINDKKIIHSPQQKLIKKNVNKSFDINFKRVKLKTNKNFIKKLNQTNNKIITNNNNENIFQFNYPYKINNDNKYKLEICNISNINIFGTKILFNNNNINDNRNIIIIINNNENKESKKENNYFENYKLNNIINNNYDNKNNEFNVNIEDNTNKNIQKYILNKINNSKNQINNIKNFNNKNQENLIFQNQISLKVFTNLFI